MWTVTQRRRVGEVSTGVKDVQNLCQVCGSTGGTLMDRVLMDVDMDGYGWTEGTLIMGCNTAPELRREMINELTMMFLC